MENYKEKYLLSIIGFGMEDLSLNRQSELKRIISANGYSREWVLAALSKKPLSNWETYGFKIFENKEFASEVDIALDMIGKWDEGKSKKQYEIGLEKKGVGGFADPTEKAIRQKWHDAKAQGGVAAPIPEHELKTEDDGKIIYNRTAYTPERLAEVNSWFYQYDSYDDMPIEKRLAFCASALRLNVACAPVKNRKEDDEGGSDFEQLWNKIS